MARALATMTPKEVAEWEERLRDQRLFNTVAIPDGAPCLECGEPTQAGQRCKQRHIKCYNRWKYP